jgi:transposase
VTLDGPDGWAKGWILHDQTAPTRLRRQQGDCEIIGPFKVDDGVKLNSENYCKLLDETFFRWYKSKSRTFKRDCIFMQDNAPSHASKATAQFLAKKGFPEKKIMSWPASSPDVNPIENMWALLKKELYKGGRQFKSKAGLWDAIQSEIKKIRPQTVKALTNSMDSRLIKII